MFNILSAIKCIHVCNHKQTKRKLAWCIFKKKLSYELAQNLPFIIWERLRLCLNFLDTVNMFYSFCIPAKGWLGQGVTCTCIQTCPSCPFLPSCSAHFISNSFEHFITVCIILCFHDMFAHLHSLKRSTFPCER